MCDLVWEVTLLDDNRQFFVNVETLPVQEDSGLSWSNPGGSQAVAALTGRLVSQYHAMSHSQLSASSRCPERTCVK